ITVGDPTNHKLTITIAAIAGPGALNQFGALRPTQCHGTLKIPADEFSIHIQTTAAAVSGTTVGRKTHARKNACPRARRFSSRASNTASTGPSGTDSST